MNVTTTELKQMAKLVEELCGIVLDNSKTYLLEQRLVPVAEANKCVSLADLYKRVRETNDRYLKKEVIDAITTGETYFFRDGKPFELLRELILPEIVEAKRKSGDKSLRVWSAASSSGQEAYSVAMTVRQVLGRDVGAWSVQIQGTDISEDIVGKASAGEYLEHEVRRGMDQKMIDENFEQIGDKWKVKPHLAEMVDFKVLNLLSPFTRLGKFDVVLIRNVAIYFDLEVRRDLFDRAFTRLEFPHGRLVVGNTESLTDIGYTPTTWNGTRYYDLNSKS